MKKILFILLILFLCFGGYILYDNNKGIPKLKTEEEGINIDRLFVYGNHFNLHGDIVSDNNLELVLYNGEFITYSININDKEFNLSDKLNEGIDLEKIPVGEYYAFLRSTNKDKEDKDIYKYYVLNNKTKYKETEYYTFSNVDNKILINSDNDYKTLMFKVSENKDKDIYDVVIDPGHGGMDSGANKNGYKESDLTLKVALKLKKNLEEYGVKVKLTRTEGQLTLNDKLPDYGVHGRAVIPYEVKAKYVFSIHLNSNGSTYVNGLEVYAPGNINYDFAKSLAKNIKEGANTNYSTNRLNKKFDGVYNRMFTESDIASARKEYESKDMKPYDVTVNSNYYFIIRETGGIVTGAYVDDRNEDVLGNPYYKSNVGAETYLLELGYLSNKNDFDNINNNMNKYSKAIANTFKSVFENTL